MKTLTVCAILLGSLLFVTTSAWACSCGSGACMTNTQLMQGNAIVFVGVVQSVQLVQAPGPAQPLPREGGAKVTFRITENLTGAAGTTIVINNAPGSCAYSFQSGMEYLVYANSATNTLMPCAGISVSQESKARIEQLKAIRDGRALPDITGVVLGSLVGYGFTPGGTSVINQTLVNAKPATGVSVVAKSATAEYRARTSDSGLYELRGLPPDIYTVTLDPPSAGLPLRLGASQPSQSVRLYAGASCRADFRLN